MGEFVIRDNARAVPGTRRCCSAQRTLCRGQRTAGGFETIMHQNQIAASSSSFGRNAIGGFGHTHWTDIPFRNSRVEFSGFKRGGVFLGRLQLMSTQSSDAEIIRVVRGFNASLGFWRLVGTAHA